MLRTAESQGVQSKEQRPLSNMAQWQSLVAAQVAAQAFAESSLMSPDGRVQSFPHVFLDACMYVFPHV